MGGNAYVYLSIAKMLSFRQVILKFILSASAKKKQTRYRSNMLFS